MREVAAYTLPVALLALAVSLAWPAISPIMPDFPRIWRSLVNRTPDRCTLTLVEQDPDDHSTTETRARLSDGQ